MASNWPENCQKLMLGGRIKYKYSSVVPSRFSDMTQVKKPATKKDQEQKEKKETLKTLKLESPELHYLEHAQ